MIKLHFFIMLLGISVSAISQGIKGTNWASVQQRKQGELIVFHAEAENFSTKNNQSGAIEGICGEIFKDFIQFLKDEKGVTITPKYVGDGKDFYEMYNIVKESNGGVIGLGDIGINSERKSEISFTNAYFFSSDIMITSKGVPDLTSMEDIPTALKGFKAYTIKGTVGESLTNMVKEKYLPNLEVVYVMNSEIPTKVGTDSKSFAFVGTDLLTSESLKSLKYQKAFKGESSGLAFIMPKDTDWVPVFGEFFNSNGGYLLSTRYKKIVVDHVGLASYRFSSLLERREK